MTTTLAPTTWAHRIEEATRLDATNAGDSWSDDDLELVIAFTDDETDEALAYATGRTLYAIWAVQHRVRSGELTLDWLRARRERTAARPAASVCSGCFTELTPAGTCLC